jgi:uncharacterized membrane protein
MREEAVTAHRLAAFSDGVIAVVITLMALELKAPEHPTLAALRPLWPTAISYAVSYLLVAIIWINHHHLMRFVGRLTPKLIWINFAHLFVVTLATLVSLAAPRFGFGLVCAALILHVRPETPDVRPLAWLRRGGDSP